MSIRKIAAAAVLTIFLILSRTAAVEAQVDVLGIHLLSPDEVGSAKQLLSTKNGSSHYVTIPFTMKDLEQKSRWENFFREVRIANLKPLLRLTTKFENGSWVIPNRADIMAMSRFLTSLDWETDELTVILYNEPNHAKEWGGRIDPEGYGKILDFAIDWLKTEPKKYVVLPAGLDLAAPNSKDTMEAFTFWGRAAAVIPEVFAKLDGWTSHSYPNPGFAGTPWNTDKRSLRGYQHELAFLARYTDKQLPVYITETGWNHDTLRPSQIITYYKVAYRDVWNKDPRIKAVTPFLLQGAPGIFAPFSFLDALGKPTKAYAAYQNILGISE